MWNKEKFEAYFKECDDTIKQHGHLIQGVFSSTPNGVGFMYTVGLTNSRNAEIYVSGYIPVIKPLMNKLGSDATAGGGYLIDTVQTDDNLVIGGKPMRYKLVIPTNIPNIKSEMKLCHHYNNDDFNVIQLLWADGNNLLPGEDGYSDTGQIVF